MIKGTLRTIRPPVLAFRDYLGYRLRANVISPDIFIAHHHLAMYSQQRPIRIVSTTPSSSFIHLLRPRRDDLCCCFFGLHVCPRLPSFAHPFLAFNALSPFPPTRAKGQFFYDVCTRMG